MLWAKKRFTSIKILFPQSISQKPSVTLSFLLRIRSAAAAEWSVDPSSLCHSDIPFVRNQQLLPLQLRLSATSHLPPLPMSASSFLRLFVGLDDWGLDSFVVFLLAKIHFWFGCIQNSKTRIQSSSFSRLVFPNNFLL